MISGNSRIRFGLQIVFVCLYITPSHYHHCANLSEDTEVIKCLSDIFCRVCKIKHIFSVIEYPKYGAVCFQFTHFPYDDWEDIHLVLLSSSNRKYFTLFMVRSWNNGMRCMSLYILMNKYSMLIPNLFLAFFFWNIVFLNINSLLTPCTVKKNNT